MYIIGDIGNTETKICLFDSKKKLLKKKIFNTASIKNFNLNKNLNFINPYNKKIKKIIFSSVVPEVFKNNRDDQAGLFLASFIEKEHYPFGKRDKEDVPDLTANMFLDYTLFAY